MVRRDTGITRVAHLWREKAEVVWKLSHKPRYKMTLLVALSNELYKVFSFCYAFLSFGEKIIFSTSVTEQIELLLK